MYEQAFKEAVAVLMTLGCYLEMKISERLTIVKITRKLILQQQKTGPIMFL